MGSRYSRNDLGTVALNRLDTVIQGSMAEIFSLLDNTRRRNAGAGNFGSANAQRDENPCS